MAGPENTAGPAVPGRGRPAADPGLIVANRVVRVEEFTGGSALLCGALLVARPDGALLRLPTRVLQGTPFRDWRLPGALLAGFVGVGFLGAAAVERRGGRWARQVSAAAGLGLVAFEAAEWRWLGFHPLQALFMAVGIGVTVASVSDQGPASR